MSVPIPALMAATTNEMRNVSWSAASAWGLVMALMNDSRPSENARPMTAATGIRTIRPR